MKAKLALGLVATILFGVGESLSASTFYEQPTVCPVGGGRFNYTAHASHSTWGGYPDGMPIGSTQFPILPPVCPDNGLVMFREFTPEEVTRLTAFVGSAEFQIMRRTETTMFIAAALARYLDGRDNSWILLSATWEAKNANGSPAQIERYQRAFVDSVSAAEGELPTLERAALLARRANALRELGRQSDAEQSRLAAMATLSAIDSSSMTVDDRRELAENIAGWRDYLTSLQPVIAAGDTRRAPLSLLPARMAAIECIDNGLDGHAVALSDGDRQVCVSPAVAGEIEDIRRMRREVAR